MNLNPGTSDKGVKQINRSHRGVESTGMSIKFMFWHFKKTVVTFPLPDILDLLGLYMQFLFKTLQLKDLQI